VLPPALLAALSLSPRRIHLSLSLAHPDIHHSLSLSLSLCAIAHSFPPFTDEDLAEVCVGAIGVPRFLHALSSQNDQVKTEVPLLSALSLSLSLGFNHHSPLSLSLSSGF